MRACLTANRCVPNGNQHEGMTPKKPRREVRDLRAILTRYGSPQSPAGRESHRQARMIHQPLPPQCRMTSVRRGIGYLWASVHPLATWNSPCGACHACAARTRAHMSMMRAWVSPFGLFRPQGVGCRGARTSGGTRHNTTTLLERSQEH